MQPDTCHRTKSKFEEIIVPGKVMQQFHKQIVESEKVHHRFLHEVQDSGREVNISIGGVLRFPGPLENL